MIIEFDMRMMVAEVSIDSFLREFPQFKDRFGAIYSVFEMWPQVKQEVATEQSDAMEMVKWQSDLHEAETDRSPT